jgi:hypothetical protein
MSAGTPSEAARVIGCSVDTLMRAWPMWARSKGFPPPLDVGTRGTHHWRFDIERVIRWKESGGTAPPPSALPLSVDWALIARRRGEALDAGLDPDLIPELNPA